MGLRCCLVILLFEANIPRIRGYSTSPGRRSHASRGGNLGDSPTFAQDSYVVLKQGNRLIKPERIRFGARASPISPGQGASMFRAKIVASFYYDAFDVLAQTIIKVFPGAGGEVSFDLDFADIP